MEPEKARNTKEKILFAAIDLFTEKGYRDISVREIASAVGIKASSLYKHYENKEAILESIFDFFRRKIQETEFPADDLRKILCSMTPEEYLDSAFDMFKQVMWTPQIVKIARIITVEQQRSKSVREFFISELIEKPNQMLQHVFDLMVDIGTIGAANTRILAEEYNAYIVYLFFQQNFLEESPSLSEIDRKMKQHNAFFAQNVLRKRS